MGMLGVKESYYLDQGFLAPGKELFCNVEHAGDEVQLLSQEDGLEEEMAHTPVFLPERVQTEEPRKPVQGLKESRQLND